MRMQAHSHTEQARSVQRMGGGGLTLMLCGKASRLSAQSRIVEKMRRSVESSKSVMDTMLKWRA